MKTSGSKEMLTKIKNRRPNKLMSKTQPQNNTDRSMNSAFSGHFNLKGQNSESSSNILEH